MISTEYQQVIENFYEKVVVINYNRLKKGIAETLAGRLSSPMPFEVHIEAVNTLNAICSYYDVLLKKSPNTCDSSWFQACRFANNRIKHDKRTAGMIQKNGGFYFYNGQCFPGIQYEEPFRPNMESDKPIYAPFFVSLVPDVNWVLVGDIQPDPDDNDYVQRTFRNQKKAYREHFEGRSVLGTLRMVLDELGIVLSS